MLTTKIYKHCNPGRHVLFFIQLADGWYHYTAQWYSQKYPWSGQWRRLARSAVVIDTAKIYVSSAGNELKLELSSPLEFLVLTGRDLQESVEEMVEAITKI